MKPDQSREDEAHLDFVAWWATRIWGFNLEHSAHPVNAYRGMQEAGFSASQLRSGLKQAVRDCVTSAADLPLSKVEEIDRELRAANLPTLTSLRAKFTRALAAILKKGCLRSESDYYLAVNLLEDEAACIPLEERRVLEEMIVSWKASA